MIKINVIAVGKVKEQYFEQGIQEYAKRLSRFCDFNIIEISEENYKKTDDATIKTILEKEGAKILPLLKGYVFALAIEGKKFSSENFSKEIEKRAVEGKGTITFIIGGSYGILKEIKDKANSLISFSDMTFPHTLFRLMLTEQIYRAFCINSGTSYHK